MMISKILSCLHVLFWWGVQISRQILHKEK